MRKKSHAHTIYELNTADPKNRMKIIKEIPINNQGFFISKLPKKLQKEILSRLKSKEITSIIHYLDLDKATDLLQKLPKYRRKRIVDNLSRDMKQKVEFLLKFNPKTAAGLMSLEYIEVDPNNTFEQISRITRNHEKRTGRFPAILIVEEGFLVGELQGHTLAIGRKKEKIKNYIKKVPHINFNKDENAVINRFKKYQHDKIIVLDEDNSILGLIYSDDILKLIQKKSENNLSDFAGISEEEDVLDSAWLKVKRRYKWLIINLGTSFLAASIVGIFQKTISAFVLLAVYMPIVAGMGGNAGTQSLAVTVRGLSLKEISLSTGKKAIFNEMLAGLVNGAINGILVAAVAIFWNKSPLLGLVLGIALIINLIIAGFFGTIIPLIMKKLGKDPATSATIFITTCTDVLGFLVFLGLASFIL